MTLEQFLKRFNGKESDIVEFKGNEALKAVEKNGYALRYVNKSIFNPFLELTIKDIELMFGCSVKIVDNKGAQSE